MNQLRCLDGDDLDGFERWYGRAATDKRQWTYCEDADHRACEQMRLAGRCIRDDAEWKRLLALDRRSDVAKTRQDASGATIVFSIRDSHHDVAQ